MAITCQGLGLEWAINEIENCLSKLLEMTNQGEIPTQMIKPEIPKSHSYALTK